YLQEMTHAEAARRLGCPPGTVATRLSRARALLRARLLRRGVTLSAAALAAALAREAAAAVAPRLPAVAPAGGVSAHVVALTEGVCRAMLMEKMRLAVMALVAAAAVGALVLGYRSGAAEPGGPPSAVPVTPEAAAAKDDGPAAVRTTNFEVTAPTR